MKFAFATTLFIVATVAQDNGIPECAKKCIDDAVKAETSCSTTDYPCICPHINDVQGAATSCVVTACGFDKAVNEVIPAAKKLCENAAKPASSAAESISGGSAPAAESTSAGSAPAAESTSASSALATQSSAPATQSAAAPTTKPGSQTHSVAETISTTVPVAGAAGLFANIAAVVVAALAI